MRNSLSDVKNGLTLTPAESSQYIYISLSFPEMSLGSLVLPGNLETPIEAAADRIIKTRDRILYLKLNFGKKPLSM